MPVVTRRFAAKLRRRVLILLACALWPVPAHATDDPITLRVHHFLPATSLTHTDLLVPWAETVQEESDGRLQVRVFPAMQLGGRAPQLLDQARDGVVEAIWTLPGYTPGRFPRLEVFELPFLPASAEATSQAAQAFTEAHLQEMFAAQTLHPLLVHVHGPGVFHLRGQPVARLEDLKNRKVRAPSRMTNKALAALGATPVGMPVPQVPQALARGVIDGAVLPWEVTTPLQVARLVDTHTVVRDDRGFYTAVFLFAMNKDTYDALPEDLRTVVDTASGLPLARRIGRAWDEADVPGVEAALAAENTIVTLPPEEVARWRKATAPVVAAWVQSMDAAGYDGTALLAEARALVDHYVAESGNDDPAAAVIQAEQSR